MDADIMFNREMLETFLPASEVEAKEMAPLSTWLLNKCMDQPLPLLVPVTGLQGHHRPILKCVLQLGMLLTKYLRDTSHSLSYTPSLISAISVAFYEVFWERHAAVSSISTRELCDMFPHLPFLHKHSRGIWYMGRLLPATLSLWTSWHGRYMLLIAPSADKRLRGDPLSYLR